MGVRTFAAWRERGHGAYVGPRLRPQWRAERSVAQLCVVSVYARTHLRGWRAPVGVCARMFRACA